MKTLYRVTFSLIILLPIFLGQCLAETFNSGFAEISDKYEQDKLTLKVWYPTQATPKNVSLGYFQMKVARNAEIAQGKHGLIIISHGDGGSDLGHRNFGLYLSKHGYIVVSIMHPNNNYKQNNHSRTTENWIYRPKHVKAVLNIIEQSKFKPFINPDKVSMIGFSAGAYTATAIIGGKVDVSNIKKHCTQNEKEDAEFCRPNKLNVEQRLIDIFQQKDDRIKSAVILAPMGVLFYGQNMLDDIHVPVLLISAEKDDVLPRKFHA